MAANNHVKITALLPLPVDVDFDLIRFEKNLLNIGFFSSHDPRTKNQNRSSRRMEQTVNQDGKRIRVSVEFQSSEVLGLPSTADRDKFLAFMKIVNEERAREGFIGNKIRFRGSRLLKELGISRSGRNYDDIYEWGRRLAQTTITSEKVIYLPSRKRYSDRTVHVFRSFQRVGESNNDGSDRVDLFEIELEDWLLENLNHGYVVPEDFNAYKLLSRPTAKGIFGNLHLWFHASQGKSVEKDYVELCNYLNVTPYQHLSKIKSTMGASLDELTKIKYLSSWQVQPMATKRGYKIVMLPGEVLLRVIQHSQKKQITDKAPTSYGLNQIQQKAFDVLVDHGVLPQKARMLVMQYDPELILDQVEVCLSQLFDPTNGRQKIANPPGFIVYQIENGLPVPTTFITERKRKEFEAQKKQKQQADEIEWTLRTKYGEWKDELLNAEVAARYPSEQLPNVLEGIIKNRIRKDPKFKASTWTRSALEQAALALLRKELLEELALPEFEDWKAERPQAELFH
ncbi:replication initiator protein A [Edaphobacter modestus]|uniref:Replication initiator protein A n=1 Tax=Edaphobacter modestus TaxID=388466 RepID=A0A4Q7YH09_9BACT|nr:replication initiator protein A [Edaphobacter modestus]RZU35629.1 replication initiator protein A [Edaphobacter modestus]